MRSWAEGVITLGGVLAAFLASLAAVSGLIVLLDEIIRDPHSAGRHSGWLLLAAAGLFLCSLVLRKWYRVRFGEPHDEG
ncbi:hypothetical protein [Salinispora vitiensis]|uniref:hypothetical protein n=1 Tax=Salinispora vitiensis TaxID=999544 RepID=UPI000377E6F7|nr:hypothetical protein [Salinispora vitiensis]